MNVKEPWVGRESFGHKICCQAMDISRALLIHYAHYRTSTIKKRLSSMGVRAI